MRRQRIRCPQLERQHSRPNLQDMVTPSPAPERSAPPKSRRTRAGSQSLEASRLLPECDQPAVADPLHEESSCRSPGGVDLILAVVGGSSTGLPKERVDLRARPTCVPSLRLSPTAMMGLGTSDRTLSSRLRRISPALRKHLLEVAHAGLACGTYRALPSRWRPKGYPPTLGPVRTLRDRPRSRVRNERLSDLRTCLLAAKAGSVGSSGPGGSDVVSVSVGAGEEDWGRGDLGLRVVVAAGRTGERQHQGQRGEWRALHRQVLPEMLGRYRPRRHLGTRDPGPVDRPEHPRSKVKGPTVRTWPNGGSARGTRTATKRSRRSRRPPRAGRSWTPTGRSGSRR